MKSEKYAELSELLATLKELCYGISIGAKEVANGISVFKEGLQKRSFFIRSFAAKDFESGAGLKADEWIDFAERLSKRFQNIANTLQEAQDHILKSEFEKILGDLNNLRTVAKPFVDNVNLVIETFNRLERYMGEAPERAKYIPKFFLSREDQRMMVEEYPKAAEEIKKLVEVLGEAKRKIQEVESIE
jgi:hypothetical protein